VFLKEFCEQPKCQNGGKRTKIGESGKCKCPDSYEGVFCEIEKIENTTYPGYILITVIILAILIVVIITAIGIKLFSNFYFKF
jgi:hypothetical protein